MPMGHPQIITENDVIDNYEDLIKCKVEAPHGYTSGFTREK